ncbi:cytochrome c551 [Paenibacillus tianmuensis]|uniref:Cytochrome c551 n=1 Tax=Paenibacillus tianmuensis TaxID=624147 RepID=A0A1G4RX27_9BACL|nr:cytochrome c [Paenibacillus tianmuensis]SCW61298.1 cytochrome c551 [Paenibacillus tianmuensis]
MKRWKQWAAAAAVLTVLATVTACTPNSTEPFGGGKKESGLTAEQAMVGSSEQVQSLYKQNCLSCHASNLEGRMGPKTNLQQVGERMTKEQIVKQIEQGGGGMPGFQGKLKPEEATALAEWLASKK